MLKQTCIERSAHKCQYGACVRNIPPTRLNGPCNLGYLFERIGDKNHEPVVLRSIPNQCERLERGPPGSHCDRSRRSSSSKRHSCKSNSYPDFNDSAPISKPFQPRRSPSEERLNDVESQIYKDLESARSTFAPKRTNSPKSNKESTDKCRDACDKYINTLLSSNKSTHHSVKSEKPNNETYNNADLILRRIATQLQGIQRILQCKDNACKSQDTQTGQYPKIQTCPPLPFCTTNTCPISNRNGETMEKVMYPSNKKKIVGDSNSSGSHVGCCFKSKCCRKRIEKSKFCYPGNCGASTPRIKECVRNGDYVNDLISKCIAENTQFCTMNLHSNIGYGQTNQITATTAQPIVTINQGLQTQRLQADANIQTCYMQHTMNRQVSAHIQEPIVNADYLNKLICLCNENYMQSYMTRHNKKQPRCLCDRRLCNCLQTTPNAANTTNTNSDPNTNTLNTTNNNIVNSLQTSSSNPEESSKNKSSLGTNAINQAKESKQVKNHFLYNVPEEYANPYQNKKTDENTGIIPIDQKSVLSKQISEERSSKIVVEAAPLASPPYNDTLHLSNDFSINDKNNLNATVDDMKSNDFIGNTSLGENNTKQILNNFDVQSDASNLSAESDQPKERLTPLKFDFNDYNDEADTQYDNKKLRNGVNSNQGMDSPISSEKNAKDNSIKAIGGDDITEVIKYSPISNQIDTKEDVTRDETPMHFHFGLTDHTNDIKNEQMSGSEYASTASDQFTKETELMYLADEGKISVPTPKSLQSIEVNTLLKTDAEVQNSSFYTTQKLNSGKISVGTQVYSEKRKPNHELKSYDDIIQQTFKKDKSLEVSARDSLESIETSTSDPNQNASMELPKHVLETTKIDLTKIKFSLTPARSPSTSENDSGIEKVISEDEGIFAVAHKVMVHTATSPILFNSEVIPSVNVGVNNIPFTETSAIQTYIPKVLKEDRGMITQGSSLIKTNSRKSHDCCLKMTCYEMDDATTNTLGILTNEKGTDQQALSTNCTGIQVDVKSREERGIDVQSSSLNRFADQITDLQIKPPLHVEQIIDVQKSLLPTAYNTQNITSPTLFHDLSNARTIGDDNIQILYMPKIFTKNVDTNTRKVSQANASVKRQTSLISKTQETCAKCSKLPIPTNISTNTSNTLHNTFRTNAKTSSAQKDVCTNKTELLKPRADTRSGTRPNMLLDNTVKTTARPTNLSTSKLEQSLDDQLNDCVNAALFYLRPVVQNGQIPRPDKSGSKRKCNNGNDSMGLNQGRASEKGKELEGKSTQNCPFASGSGLGNSKLISAHKSDIINRRSVKSGLAGVDESKKNDRSSPKKCNCPTLVVKSSAKTNCSCNKKHKQP